MGVRVTASARVLAVDPGARGCGVALFEDRALVCAAYVQSPLDVTADTGRAAAAGAMALAVIGWLDHFAEKVKVDALVVEWPRVYATAIRRGVSRGDPNDLLPLAGVDSALAALLAPAACYSYAPSEWKGQLTKEACSARVMGRLTNAEFGVLEAAVSAAKSKAHNTLDAVGLGLHHLSRFTARRVLA